MSQGVRHGTNSGYLQHVLERGGWTKPACDECRHAAATAQKIMRIRRSREGPLRLDATPYRLALLAAQEAGESILHVGRLAGFDNEHVLRIKNGQIRRINRTTAVKLEKALRTAATQRMEAWGLCVDHLDSRHPKPDFERLWPVSALSGWADRNYVSLRKTLNEADYRQVHRHDHLTDTEADRIAVGLGTTPDRIWADWWEGAA